MKCNLISSIGFIVLALYLILIGVVAFVPNITIPSTVSPILALVSGIFILIGRCKP